MTDHHGVDREGSTAFTIAADHPAFAGHFPDRPIVPGVVLLDCAIRAIEDAEGIQLLPAQIGAAKFLQPVGPGAALQVIYRTGNSGLLQIEIAAHGVRVATLSLQRESP